MDTNKPNKHGQIEGDRVYCPLYNDWIGLGADIKARSSRTNYDDQLIENKLEFSNSADDFNKLATNGGWELPKQLLEAVTVCQFCESYCLGEENGPNSVPSFDQIDRVKLLKEVNG